MLKKPGAVRAPETRMAPQAWPLLVVDDRARPQGIYHFVMPSLVFERVPIRLVDACSVTEAVAIVEARQDIAVVLLRLSSSGREAGLAFARHVRGALGNRLVRILLYVDGPAQMSDWGDIVLYDIDECKPMSDVSILDMHSAVMRALREYCKVMALGGEPVRGPE